MSEKDWRDGMSKREIAEWEFMDEISKISHLIYPPEGKFEI